MAAAPEVVAAQYANSANLQSRIGLYAYLEPDKDSPARLEAWVLDHVDWTSSLAVADVGCGPGPYLAELSARAGTVLALDLSVGMLREARGRSTVSAIVADAQRLPVADASLDVVLAAHMLYHLPDIDAGIGEFRRVLRSGGTLLAPLNGAQDKAEIRTVWRAAAAAVTGSAFEPPHWGSRINLDNAPPMIGSHFASVTVDRLPGIFRFRSPDPPLAWIDSLRAGTEDLVGNAEWAAIGAEVRRSVDHIIALDGAFVVTKESGVVVAN